MANHELAESDYDSDYANHPPPTDSEAEIEYSRERLPPYVSSSSSLSTLASAFPASRPSSSSLAYRGRNHGTSSEGTPATLHSRTESRETLLENEDLVNQAILFGISSTATSDLNVQRNSLKELGLKRLTPRHHLAVAFCRDFSLVVIFKYLFILWKSSYIMMNEEVYHPNVTSARASEYFLAGIWCIVTGFLSYSILDGLMVRWIVMYAIQAAIVRMLSMSLFIISLVEVVSFMFNNEKNEYCLPTWIMISCIMTLIYIIQNFVTSNLRLDRHLLNKELFQTDELKEQQPLGALASEVMSALNGSTGAEGSTLTNLQARETSETIQRDTKKDKVPRTVDLYNIVVFAVVPIGLASFITVIGLIRLVLIMRLEVGMEFSQLGL